MLGSHSFHLIMLNFFLIDTIHYLSYIEKFCFLVFVSVIHFAPLLHINLDM